MNGVSVFSFFSFTSKYNFALLSFICNSFICNSTSSVIWFDLYEFLNGPIEVKKIFAFYSDVDLVNKAKAEIQKISGLAVSSSFVSNIEITNENAQKGLILAKVAKKMGIKKDEVMIMGDSFNDYSMFTEFTETVAMENAIPEIKKIAKYITDTNENNGVAKAIRKILK